MDLEVCEFSGKKFVKEITVLCLYSYFILEGLWFCFIVQFEVLFLIYVRVFVVLGDMSWVNDRIFIKLLDIW